MHTRSRPVRGAVEIGLSGFAQGFAALWQWIDWLMGTAHMNMTQMTQTDTASHTGFPRTAQTCCFAFEMFWDFRIQGCGPFDT